MSFKDTLKYVFSIGEHNNKSKIEGLLMEAEKEFRKSKYNKAVEYLDRAKKICDDYDINGNLSRKIIELNLAYRPFAAKASYNSTE